MCARKVFTFKSGPQIQHAISVLMERLELDRTSVIKLALYCFTAYVIKKQFQSVSLFQLVRELEKFAAGELPDFEEFSEK